MEETRVRGAGAVRRMTSSRQGGVGTFCYGAEGKKDKRETGRTGAGVTFGARPRSATHCALGDGRHAAQRVRAAGR